MSYMEEQNFLQSFGERLKEERLSLGLSQLRFSQLTGFSQKYIRDMEKGKKFPSLTKLRHMCDVLNLDMKYLIYGKEHTHYELLGESKKCEELKYLLSQCDETQYDLCMKIIRAFLCSSLSDSKEDENKK